MGYIWVIYIYYMGYVWVLYFSGVYKVLSRVEPLDDIALLSR